MILEIKVKPNTTQSALEPSENGTWIARLKSPPVEGKANAELIQGVARRFGCRKSAIVIKRGGAGRIKILEIPPPPVR